MCRRGRGRANSRPRDHATRRVSTSDSGECSGLGRGPGVGSGPGSVLAAPRVHLLRRTPRPRRLDCVQEHAVGCLLPARGDEAVALLRRGDTATEGQRARRGSGSARRACTARWSVWSVESVECAECMCSLVLLACCASCSRSADVAVVKLWWMPPTLRGVTGASSRWRMKVGASQGSGSGCLRPCSRRSARVSQGTGEVRTRGSAHRAVERPVRADVGAQDRLGRALLLEVHERGGGFLLLRRRAWACSAALEPWKGGGDSATCVSARCLAGFQAYPCATARV